MIRNLSPITGHNKWCGPAALSALVGIPTDDVAQLLELRINDGRSVEQCRPVDVIFVLEDLGWRVERYKAYPKEDRPTLFTVALLFAEEASSYLMVTPTHFFAYSAGKMACSQHRVPVVVNSALPAASWPVSAIWKVIPPGSA